jgi:hypothetical protein
MIRGYFLRRGGRRRPFVHATLQFPTLDNQSLEVRLLIDTGADRTLLSPADAIRLGIDSGLDFATLPQSAPSTGVGGQVNTRTIEAVLTLESFSMSLSLTILEPPPGPLPTIPSLLGRDILSRFALFMEERTNRLFLLEPEEADALQLPLGERT